MAEDLKSRLLAAYIKADKGRPEIEAIIACEKPFYEMGKFCAEKYAKNPSEIFNDSGLADIMKRVFGEHCRKAGEAMFEEQKYFFKDMVLGKEARLEKQVAKLQERFYLDYLSSLAEFNLGYCSGAGEAAQEFTQDIIAKNIELFNIFGRPFGFSLPNGNHYSEKFIKMLDKRNIDGMIELYSKYSKEIDKEYTDAKDFVGFLESVKHFY